MIWPSVEVHVAVVLLLCDCGTPPTCRTPEATRQTAELTPPPLPPPTQTRTRHCRQHQQRPAPPPRTTRTAAAAAAAGTRPSPTCSPTNSAHLYPPRERHPRPVSQRRHCRRRGPHTRGPEEQRVGTTRTPRSLRPRPRPKHELRGVARAPKLNFCRVERGPVEDDSRAGRIRARGARAEAQRHHHVAPRRHHALRPHTRDRMIECSPMWPPDPGSNALGPVPHAVQESIPCGWYSACSCFLHLPSHTSSAIP